MLEHMTSICFFGKMRTTTTPPGSYSTRVLYDFDKRHHPQHIFCIIVPWVSVGTICFHEQTPPPSIFCIIVPWVPVGTICFHERTPPPSIFCIIVPRIL